MNSNIFMNLILIACLVYIALKLFKHFSGSSEGRNKGTPEGKYDPWDHIRGKSSSNQNDGTPRDPNSPPPPPEKWGQLRGNPNAAPQTPNGKDAPAPTAPPAPVSNPNAPERSLPLPKGFDEADFLKGAKLMYIRVQEAWDEQDMDELATWTTPEMFKELEAQAGIQDDEHSDSDPNAEQAETRATESHNKIQRTEIMLLSASVVEAGKKAGKERVVVYFDALVQEDPDEGNIQKREIWHFVRDLNPEPGMWLLDAVQDVQ